MSADPQVAKELEPLKKSTVALLTTYKRNGDGVGTPVGRILKEDRVYFTTRSKTWKVKRLKNNPRATLAPCTRMGKPTGDTVEGVVRRAPVKDKVDMSTFEKVQGAVWVFAYKLIYRDVPLTYEFRPAPPGVDPFAGRE